MTDKTPNKPHPEAPPPDALRAPAQPYDEFEVGEHKVPWFLWLFFTFIIVWASLSWIPFFGY